ILTHDKGFFNLIRRNTDEEEWVYLNFNKDEKDSSAPKIKEDESPIQRAIKRFEEGEFEASGTELRKEADAILDSFLDPDIKFFNQKFKGLSQKLDDAFKQLIDKRHKDFTEIFINDLDLSKLKKIKTDYSTDGTLTAEEIANLDSIK